MLVSHPLGNSCVRAVLEGLSARGLLANYATTLGFHRGDWWIAGMPDRLRRQLERRRYDLPGERMRRWPWREAVRQAAGAAGLSRLVVHESGWASVDAVFRELDRRVAVELGRSCGVRGVYAYEDGALASFQAAEKRGLARCYELPMGYWREAQRIFREEAELQPEWAATLDGLKDSEEKLARKDAELALASHVIVASGFSRQSLATYPRSISVPVSVVPHGGPRPVGDAELKDRLQGRAKGPLRVLFVGGLTQRKGLSYLFEAMKLVGAQATLTVVGQGMDAGCPALRLALREHRHVASLPAQPLMALMREHDVLVLPSLFEGFGLVLLEAMAQGLPVIATSHTAAPDLFARGEAGIVVPIRSANAIAAAIEQLFREPDRRETLALTAVRVAGESSWAACREALVAICEQAMEGNLRPPRMP